jgi:protein transport protein SEC24
MGTLDEQQNVYMPPPLNLSSEILERHGVYLLLDGLSLYIYIGRAVSADICMRLFDCSSYEAIPQGSYTLPILKNDLSERVNTLIEYIGECILIFPSLFVVKEDGDPLWRGIFLSKLIEDRTDVAMSYPQFLTFLRGKLTVS